MGTRSGGSGLAAVVLATVRGRHVGGRGKVRDRWAGKDIRRAGAVDVGVLDARVGVAICAREGDRLVRSATLRAADLNLRAGRVKLGSTGGNGVLK